MKKLRPSSPSRDASDLTLAPTLPEITPTGRLARGVHDWLPVEHRHATPVLISGRPMLIEIWSVEEFDRLPDAYKPESVHVVPGVGWLAFREPESPVEVREVRRECERASAEQWAARYGSED